MVAVKKPEKEEKQKYELQHIDPFHHLMAKGYPSPLSVALATLLSMKRAPICPACQSGQVKEIVYGLPDIKSFDFEKYEVGGCCVSDNDPSFKCKSCDLEF